MHRQSSIISPLFGRLDLDARRPQRQELVSMYSGRVVVFIAVDMMKSVSIMGW